jgi:hypothetical protein
MRFARRREIWWPTAWGWCALTLGAAVAAILALLGTYPFLAVNQPVGAKVLVVEGWLTRGELRQAIGIFHAGGYAQVVTTGGPLHSWPQNLLDSTYAHRSADFLKRNGLGSVSVTPVPSPITHQDRTYNSALMVRDWARRSGIELDRIDVLSRGPHARRSRLLYEAAFGPATRIGILAARPRDYDPTRWWKTSTGAREVTEQAAGFVWVKLLFNPSRQAPVESDDGVDNEP